MLLNLFTARASYMYHITSNLRHTHLRRDLKKTLGDRKEYMRFNVFIKA